MGAGCPQKKQAVGLLEIARERQVLIGLLVVSHAGGEQAQPHAGVSVADDAVPDDLVGPRLDELVEDRGRARAVGQHGGVGIQRQRGQRGRVRRDVLEAVTRGLLEDLRGLGSSIEIAQGRCQSGSPGRDRRVGAHALLHHLDDLLRAALIDTRLLQRGGVGKDGVGLSGLLPDLQRALE